jgi:hypothetical protein
MHKFEEANSRTFFHKFTQQFVDIGFSNPWELVIDRILETPKKIFCNFRQASLVATGFLKQSFKITGESLDDRANPKTTRCV